jgi:hypothetical protein
MLLGIAVLAIGCAGRDKVNSRSDAAGVGVTRQQYGDDWPFTVERGDLWCRSPGKNVVFVVNNVVYALNDEARAAKRWRDIDGPMWRDNPKMPGTKVSLSPLINRGLMFCGDFVGVLVTDP